MKRLITILFLLISIFSYSSLYANDRDTTVPFSSLTNYQGNLDSVRVVGLLKSGNAWTNRTFFGIDFVKSRVLYIDSGLIYITPTFLTNWGLSYYTKSQSDAKYDLIITAPFSVNKYITGYKTFGALNTDSVLEANNLYFTQARVRTTSITGFTSGAGSVSATDNILQAIQKLDGNIAGKQATLVNQTNIKSINGNSLLGSGDLVIAGGVTTVFGRSGAVVAQSGDYTFSQIGSTPTTIGGYGITDAYTKTQSDGNYYPIAGGLLAAGGYVGFPKLSSSPLSGADRIFEFMDSAGYRTIRYSSNVNGGFIREFIPNITANRQITWPDKNGTLATTTDNISQFTNNSGYLSGTVGIGNGGSGQTTQQAAIDALTGTQTNAKYLRSDGTHSTLSTIVAVDVPTLNQNTSGSAGSISGTNVITNANLAQMPANTIKINNTGAPATPIDGTVAQTKTLLNYVEGDIPSLTTDLGNKQPITTVATALTAAGTNQSTALALSGNNSIQEVTTTASGTGVKLPTASNTSSVVVVNRGANTLIVYPATSGIINGQTANLGYLLPSGAVATFFGKDATSWYTENAFTGGDAVTTDASGVITVGGIKGASVPTLTNGLLRNTGGAWSFDASTFLTAAVTSITPGWGLTPQTAITSTGAPLVDSFSVAARARVQKAIDSLNAVLPNSTNALNIAGVNFSIGGPGVQRSWSIGVSLPGQVARMTAASSAINTTETAILSSPTIAANQLTAGSSYRVTFHGTCTSTGANASNFRVRIGNTGGNTDAVVGLITPTAAASGTTIPFAVEFTLTVRTNGSSGTMEGSGQLLNNGVTGVSAATPVVGATQSITVNTTVTNIISVWYVSGATTTTSTFQDCWIECVKI